ncbi:MAG: protein kinase [Actinomycetota bacterium]|nr:protein kinase [Actinomycetota bacterium]
MGTDSRIGTDLAGYRIESLLGRGGMSLVYLAEDRRLKRRVALKVIAPELAQDQLFRQRFVRESELAASLDHPNIVPIYEAGEANGVLFIAMRYVEGIDLKALVERDGPLEPGRAVGILRQVAGALDAAHARGLVHRDVKSSNVLVATSEGEEEHAYLSDFGLTKRSASDTGALTGTGQFLGTVDYAAPEQFQRGKLDGRTDQYSLGCVAYECLVGEVPFAREHEVGTMYAHLNDPPPRPSEHRADLPPAVDAVMARALAKDPADRYGSCREFVTELAGALETSSGPRTASAAGDVPAGRRRRWTSLVIGLAAAAAVVAGVLIATLHGHGAPGPGPAASGSPSHSASPTVPASVGSPTPPFAVQPGSVLKIDPSSSQVVAQYPHGLDFVQFADGKLFVSQPDQTIAVIDPATGKLRDSIAGLLRPEIPTAFDGDHTLWVPTYHSVTPVNTRSLRPGLPVPLPQVLFDQCRTIVVGTSLWVTQGCNIPRGNPAEQDPGVLLRVDTRTKRVVEQKAVGQAPLAIASGDGFLWVANYGSGGVSQIDLSTGKQTLLDIASSPNGLVFADGELWITNYGDSTVVEYDPILHRTVNVAHLDSWAVEPQVGFGHIWVILPTYEEVDEIDPGTGQVIEHISTGSANPTSMALGAGAVWVTTEAP